VGETVPSRRMFATLTAAVLAATGLTTAAVAHRGGPEPARRPPGSPYGPETAVVHSSTQRPEQVRSHWTPERVRQAQRNMRNRTGDQD
jgi:hypothetical protein